MSELPTRRDDDLPAADSVDIDPADTDGAYDAVIVSYDDAPDECTVFPLDASEAEVVTTWVSAVEGSFVSLATMR